MGNGRLGEIRHLYRDKTVMFDPMIIETTDTTDTHGKANNNNSGGTSTVRRRLSKMCSL